MAISPNTALGNHLQAGAIFRTNQTTADYQDTPSVTALAGGGFLVSWSSYGQDGSEYGIYARRYGADGQPVGNEFLVNQTTAGDQDYSNVIPLAGGGFAISWQVYDYESETYAIYARRYGADNQPLGNEFLVSEIGDHSTITALEGGGFVVSWIDRDPDSGSYEIFARNYNDGGAPVGDAFQVNTVTDGNQIDAQVKALADGGFLVIWGARDDEGFFLGDISAQRYDDTGAPVGGEFVINPAVEDGQAYAPDVTALDNDGFLATWITFGDDGDTHVLARRFDENNVAGDAFEVFDWSGDIYGAKVTSLADGGFLITVSVAGDLDSGGSDAIYARRFDAAGNPVGAAFLVAEGENYSPVVTVMEDGSILVAWFASDSDDVYARIFTEANFVAGGTNNADDITGTGATEIIDAGLGADKMTGLGGDDTYFVDDKGDQVIEAADGGNDTVISTVSYTLAANIENLELTGTTKINATGNTGHNTLIGNAVANILKGGDGNDRLDGGLGSDQLIGGKGNDIYVVNSSGDKIVETLKQSAGGGTDTVESRVGFSLASYAYVENVTLIGQESINATGNTLVNTLTGNVGDNRLDGGIGADTMRGGDGDDDYVIENIGDAVFEEENGGDDVVILRAGALAKGVASLDLHDLRWANVEGVTLSEKAVRFVLGTEDDNNIVGNVLANTIYGGAGLDELNGGSGNDILAGGLGDDDLRGGKGNDILMGGAGDDYYFIDGGDAIIEADANGGDSGGVDRIYASFTLDLQVIAYGRIEEAFLGGHANINATGNAAENYLVGNDGKNKLIGLDGADYLDGDAGDDSLLGGNQNDYLFGGDGNDNLNGGDQNDTLEGSIGRDTMTGGAGVDTFIYFSSEEGRDTILDFQRGAGGDVIDVANVLLYETDYVDGELNLVDYLQIANGNQLQIKTDGTWSTLATFSGQTGVTLADLNLVTVVVE